MVNVSHNTYDRRTFYHKAFVFFILFQKFFDYINYFFFFAENFKFHCDLFCSIIIDFLIHCYNFSLKEQFFHDNRRNNLHFICKFFDRKNFRNYNLFNLFFFLLFFRLRSFHFCYLFLFFAFFAFSVKGFVSVFFFLIITFFIFRLITLALLLLHDRCRHIISS